MERSHLETFTSLKSEVTEEVPGTNILSNGQQGAGPLVVDVSMIGLNSIRR